MHVWHRGKKEEAEELKRKVAESAARIEELSKEEKEVEEKLKQNMMIIPNIIDPSVPIGKDDSQNVEIEKFRGAFLFLISRFHTIQRSWKHLTESILRAPEE